MKDKPIVVSFFDQLQEIFTCFGTILKIKQKMNISHCSLKYNLILFLNGFRLTHKCHFFFSLFLIDDISDNYYFRVGFRCPSSEYIESGSSVWSGNNKRIGGFSLTYSIGISIGISHLFTLKNCNSDKPLILFSTNCSFNAFIGKWIDFYSMEWRINNKFLTLVKFNIGVE